MNEGNEASSIAMAFGAARFCMSLCKGIARTLLTSSLNAILFVIERYLI